MNKTYEKFPAEPEAHRHGRIGRKTRRVKQTLAAIPLRLGRPLLHPSPRPSVLSLEPQPTLQPPRRRSGPSVGSETQKGGPSLRMGPLQSVGKGYWAGPGWYSGANTTGYFWFSWFSRVSRAVSACLRFQAAGNWAFTCSKGGMPAAWFAALAWTR